MVRVEEMSVELELDPLRRKEDCLKETFKETVEGKLPQASVAAEYVKATSVRASLTVLNATSSPYFSEIARGRFPSRSS